MVKKHKVYPGDDPMVLYFRDIEDSMGFDPKKEQELSSRILQGDHDARNELIEANLRFVVSVAKQYQNRGLILAELVSAGNIGLITAAERFDATRGFKFISYAVWWVRQAILEAIYKEPRVVPLPVNRMALLVKLAKRSVKITQELGHFPNAKEIFEGGDDEFKDEEEVEDTVVLAHWQVSLNELVENDTDLTFLDVMTDEEPLADEVLESADELAVLAEAVCNLGDEREEYIIRRYFGLDDARTQTLEQIGADLGLTRERIRQIKDKALENLREYFRLRSLKLKWSRVFV